jgi:Zinc binding domain
MNKAFVREPEPDGRAYCPQCGTLGVTVGKVTLDHHIVAESRSKLGDGAWFCGFARCDVAYFDLFERLVLVSELLAPIYPKDSSAPICPWSLRELLRKSKSKEANCGLRSPDGQCCTQEVQRLYIRGLGAMK